jgi:hypothetical protein
VLSIVHKKDKNPKKPPFRFLGDEQFAAFCLFVRTLPIDFALLGRKRKHMKSKTTAKLKGKQTSIAAVRDQFLSFATFPTTLLSRYRLPLSQRIFLLQIGPASPIQDTNTSTPMLLAL